MARWLLRDQRALTFQRSFCVQAPLDDVRLSHTLPESFQALSPPAEKAEIQRAELGPPGGDFEFTFRVGSFPVHWLARIEWTGRNSFTDYQVEGPFQIWHHEHHFHRVTLWPRLHPLWTPFGILMAAGLPILVWYRAIKTRRILSRTDSVACQPPSTRSGAKFHPGAPEPFRRPGLNLGWKIQALLMRDIR